MADNVSDAADSIRQRRNARRRELYRIQRAAETPEESEERRCRRREYMRGRRENTDPEEERRRKVMLMKTVMNTMKKTCHIISRHVRPAQPSYNICSGI